MYTHIGSAHVHFLLVNQRRAIKEIARASRIHSSKLSLYSWNVKFSGTKSETRTVERRLRNHINNSVQRDEERRTVST